MCFTVEIDKKRFPGVSDFIRRLDTEDILYMSNEYDVLSGCKNKMCYRFEFDNTAVQAVSRILSELIKNDYLRAYADNIIDINYCGLDTAERASVVSNILKMSDTEQIALLLESFISNNNHVHMGGFVLFRLKDYLGEFEDEIDFAVDEYIQQKRYRDFVKILRFFVSIQDSVFDSINVVVKNEEKYCLLDNNGNPINKDLLDSTYCELASINEDNSYIMLNDIISLSPKHITIHCRKSDLGRDYIKVIQEIFGSKIKFCHKCNMCKN